MRLADTNVLIYAVSNREADAPKRTMAETTLKEPDLALSVQVLQEFYYQATRPQGPAGLTHEQAMGFLQTVKGHYQPRKSRWNCSTRATEIRQKFGLSYWDAAILAAAKMLGCEAVYSEDMSHQEDYG